MDDDVLRFLSSMQHDSPILYYDILGSEAHSIMLHEKGHISSAELKKILRALEEAKKNPGVIDTSEAEDVHEALEAFVIKSAGMDAGGKMHTARSRNDQVVLDVRMKVRDDMNQIRSLLADLVDALLQKAAKNKDAIMPLYTHLQQGQLGTFSHFLIAYADALLRDLDRISSAYSHVNESPLGACAIGGTSIDIDRTRTASLLGFGGIVKNSIDATTSRDAFLEYVAALSILTTNLARMAEDFILWSTTEFGFIELADRYSSTSSAMPQKKNPDPLELTRAKAALIAGRLIAILGIVKGLPSGYSRDLQDLKPQLLDASSTAIDTVRIMHGVVNSLHVKKARMLEASSTSYAISLDIAEQMVAKWGLPFRSAHKLVGALVGKAAERGVPLSALSAREIQLTFAQAKIGKEMKEEEAEDIVQIIKEMTPARSIDLRRSAGSPNPAQQDEMIKASSAKLTRHIKHTEVDAKSINAAFAGLSKTVTKYLNS
jgi:argininosuccinate lyase